MTDRDTFAAAALTGLLSAPTDKDRSSEYWARFSYEIADAMLGERERTTPTPQPRTAVLSTGDVVSYTPTNHDAAPAARASAESVAPQPTAGDRSGNPTSHTGTGKQPAPPCVETDGFSSGSRPGPINRTPERQSPDRECGESSLRDVPQPDNGRAAGGPELLFTSVLPVSYAKTNAERVDFNTNRDTTQPRNGALSDGPDPDSRVWETPRTPPPQATPQQGSVQDEGGFLDSRNAKEPVAWAVMERDGFGIECTFTDRDEAAEWCDSRQQIVPLYRSPTITDAEREAMECFAEEGWEGVRWSIVARHINTLRKLLERLGGGR